MGKRLALLAGAFGFVFAVALWGVVRRAPPVPPPRPEAFLAAPATTDKIFVEVVLRDLPASRL